MDPGILMGLLKLLGLALLATGFCLAVDGRYTTPVRRLATVGAAALVLGGIGEVAFTLAPIAERLEEPLIPLMMEYVRDTRAGRLAGAPIIPALIACVVLRYTHRAHGPQPGGPGLTVVGVLLATVTLLMASGGHAGKMLGGGAVAIQALHIAAGIAWIALVLSLLPTNVRCGPLALRLQRVGNLALVLVIVIAVTGVLAAWLHGMRPEDLTSSRYGLLILLKSGLLVLALSAAAWNRFHGLRPQQVAAHGDRRLRAVVVREAAAILAILAVAAVLARTMPPGA